MLTSYILHRHDASLPPNPGWMLAIDTSSERAGIALLRDEDLHACSWPAARAQTTQVPLRVHDLLATVGITPADLVSIAVASGPGTFTGLRVGMSLAKGFAIGGRLPIVGVPTLVATAQPWVQAGVAVAAALPAGRGRLVWQCFRPDHLDDDEATSPVNGTPDELLAALPEAGVAAVVGELPRSLAVSLDSADVPVLADPGQDARIASVALLGRYLLETGHPDDLATLEPVYVHGTSRVSRPVRDRPA